MARYFLTGAQGCIGTWIVRNLIDRGDEVFIYDLDVEPKRLSMLLSPEELGAIHFIQGDITDYDRLKGEMQRNSVTHVIHLAGLQVPVCRANPRLGAMVNVVGTVNVFEAARSLPEPIQGLAYASSAAVFGPQEDYGEGPVGEGVQLIPRTHYGVFKQSNEGNARVFFLDHGISSVGLRPHAVYGAGRDFGITSGPTTAMKAAALGRPFEIQFGGPVSMLLVDDVAKIFIGCAESSKTGARAYNIRGDLVTVEEVIQAIEAVVPSARGMIRCKANPLAIASNFSQQGLKEELGQVPATPLKRGIEQTVEIFRRLHRENRLDLSDLHQE
ncbi:MAG: NAD(P)-dependent oxidoreductase [Acidobacteria bacterium]|nr:NAD(P)-dependent oxidoreductase [Acidobacteriota bacterium]